MYKPFGKAIPINHQNRLTDITKYYTTTDQCITQSLVFLGFKYYQFTYNSDTYYSFDNTILFKSTLNNLLELKETTGIKRSLLK